MSRTPRKLQHTHTNSIQVMKLRTRLSAVSTTFVLVASAALSEQAAAAVTAPILDTPIAVRTAQSEPTKGDAPDAKKSEPVDTLVDSKLEAYRTELLDLAFRSASAFPVKPHIKNRTRLQDSVVGTCLELGQARRALGYIESIDTWRRGSCYADVALYMARKGDTLDRIEKYIVLAKEVSDRVETEGAQDWARDRIRVKIAGAYMWLGLVDKAREFGAVPTEAEAGKVAAYSSMRAQTDDYDAQMQSLAKIIEIGGFDQTRSALEAYAHLFDRFYGDEVRRTTIEETIQKSWAKSPVQVRFDVMMKLVEFALAHEDPKKANALLQSTQDLVESVRWTSEDKILLLTQIAAARHRAGDTAKAKSDLDAVLAFYEKERLTISQFDRGLSLRAIADAYRKLGDVKSAVLQYGRAIEAAKKKGEVRAEVEPGAAAFCLDNLLLLFQFSFCSDYYRDRLRIFLGLPEGAEVDSESLISSMVGFARRAICA